MATRAHHIEKAKADLRECKALIEETLKVLDDGVVPNPSGGRTATPLQHATACSMHARHRVTDAEHFLRKAQEEPE